VKRRRFLAATALVAWPARGQDRRIPVVGYVNAFSARDWEKPLAAFRAGLRESGYVEGRDVAIEYRWAEGDYDRVRALAADLVKRRVAAIVATGGGKTAVDVHAETSEIPILFAIGSNPVDLRLASTLSRPGGNATGIYFLTGELEAKRLGMLRELVPSAPLIGVLINPTLPSYAARVRAIEAAASQVGQRLAILQARDDRGVDAAFATLQRDRAAALLVAADPFFLTRRDKFVDLAARGGLPAIYEQREFAEAGGLMSYGTNLNDASRELGVYVARVLKGEKPAEMPVVQSTKFEFVINKGTARRMRIAIPKSLSLRADDVIP
jgi:putative ABC transport system substrate-binding protein